MQLNNSLHKLNLSPERKARTRTLIQIGGLVDKSGLLNLLDIELGEDMEQYIPSLNKAATLLGFLISAIGSSDVNDSNKEDWLHLGLSKMKERK